MERLSGSDQQTDNVSSVWNTCNTWRETINLSMVKLHYPLYWHCDILQELMILSRAGKLDDPRTKEALDVVEKKRDPTDYGTQTTTTGA